MGIKFSKILHKFIFPVWLGNSKKEVEIQNTSISAIFSMFDKKNKVVIDQVTSVSSLAPKILTKKEDLEKVQPYLDKLKDTLNAKGINNIALTGGYGSGKSSLLKTFQHWNKNEYNFLNISLAAFNKAEENTLKNEELERQLEISILQQIIYKVNPVNLPESRFKRIVNIPNWKLWGLIPISFTIWLMSVILLFKYDYLDKLNPNTWTFRLKDLDFSTNLIFMFSFLGIGYFSKLIVELFSNSKINKVNLKGEIEIGDNSNKSILNEHYDEILYYFEKNNFNVVVIEDLDRFDNTNIFTKLRELNILLNNADSINNRNCYKDFGIKFLYAVGDDLFNDKKERVKFFEYIIPVIPFINSSNANEQLKTLIKESDLEENVFSKEFLSDITTFIDDIDMRLLINIFHEFVIYRNVLKPDVLKGNESELFAMITYKNIDPEDFNKLNNKEGKLYKLINDKSIYIKKFIDNVNKVITSKNTELKNIDNESITNIKELRKLYINHILTKFPNNAIYINDINISGLSEDIEFNKLIDEGRISYRYVRQSYYDNQQTVLTFNFSEIENEVNSDFTYEERVELIESKHNGRKSLIQKEIEKLKSEKSEIENWDLKQIFKEVDINQYLNDFSNNGLLRNLILEGYINENYNDYISLFHEVSLTKEDKKFERNIKSGFYEGFEYKLTHIENLVDNHIDLKYFKRDTILNFDLLNYLGNNYNRNTEKYDAIIGVLSNEKEKSIEFIDKYISIEERPLKIFIEKLVKNWKGFWDYIYLKSNFTPEKEDKYLSLIIQFGLIDDILSSQNNSTLSTTIAQKPHFLSLVKNTEELSYYGKITKLIEKLNIKFEELENPNEETKELFSFVFNNCYYQINKDNILQMITLYGSFDDENDFETSNYGTILQSNCNPLIDYINSSINTYVEDVYLKLEQNNSESEEVLLKLLNNVDLEDKLKIKIIQKVDTLISNLSDIENIEIKKQLLINLKVVANWENANVYYSNCENKIDEKLVEYLNTEIVSSKLSEIKIKKEDKEFEKSFLLCNDINDDIYIKLLKSTYYIYSSLNFEDLNEIKVENLIKKNLATTKINYDKLRVNFADSHISLIERDFNKFFEKIEDFETDVDDILMILKSDKITIDNRFKYIPKLTEQTIIDNKAIAKKVGEIIISKSTKVEFEFNIIESIVKSLDSTENKVKFINLYFTELSNDNIVSLVKSISHYHSELFVKQHKPLFNDNTHNRELLTKLRTKGLINSFDIYKKDNTKIRAVANY